MGYAFMQPNYYLPESRNQINKDDTRRGRPGPQDLLFGAMAKGLSVPPSSPIFDAQKSNDYAKGSMTKYVPKRRPQDWWLRYEYKHTTLAVLIIALFIVLLDSALLAATFGVLEGLGYVGGFIAGVLSVSFFTAAPALVLLVALAPELNPLTLAIAAAAGSAAGDWLILFFFQEKIFHELKPLIEKTGLTRAFKALDRPATSWILVTAGAIIISTPLPDEIGLSMMGISRLKRLYLLILCFILNGLGLWALIMATRLIVAS